MSALQVLLRTHENIKSWRCSTSPWWWPSGPPGPPGCCLSDRTRSAVWWRRRWRGRRPAGWGPGRRKGSQRTSQASSASLNISKGGEMWNLISAQILPWSLWYQTLQSREEVTMGRYRSYSRWKRLGASAPRSPCPDGLEPELRTEWRSHGSRRGRGRQNWARQTQRGQNLLTEAKIKHCTLGM